MLKAALGGDDDETVIGSEPSEDEKDYTRGLAQRGIDPEFKQRKAKGPFVVSINTAVEVDDEVASQSCARHCGGLCDVV